MILSALYQYYREASKAGKLAPLGMSYEVFAFVIVITPQGEFVRIDDLRGSDTPDGAKLLTAQPVVRTSGVKANLFWDKPLYALGWEGAVDHPHLTAFVQMVHQLCTRYPEESDFRAVKLFYDSERSFSYCLERFGEFKLKPNKSNYIGFHISTEPNPAKLVSGNRLLAQENLNGEREAFCLVTGEHLPPAGSHPQVAIGGSKISLVNFNDAPYNSYGKKSGDNAPISAQAANAYALALGHLLEGDSTKYRLGNITFVFWNEHPNEELLQNYLQATFYPKNAGNEEEEDPSQEEEDAPKKRRRKAKPQTDPDKDTYKVYDALRSIYVGSKAYIDVEAGESFFILGLLPGTGRVAVKLWKKGTVREIVGNTLQHLRDMNIVSAKGLLNEEYPPLRSVYSMLGSVSTGKTNDKWSQLLIQSVVESIVNGTPYPQTLQQACLERIRHTAPITETRAAILKAYINRKYHKDLLTMALDRTNTTPAYLLGRLFAHLELIQKGAIANANATIRDRYYGAASTTPAAVFGQLIRLSNHHLSKIKKEKPGWAYRLTQEMGDIMNLFPGDHPHFPAHLSLDEQSLFAVGYYHQKHAPWGKTDNDQATLSDQSENI